MNLSFVSDYWPSILSGFFTTFWVWGVALIISIFLGAVVYLLSISQSSLVRKVVFIYVLVFRGTPLLCQLFFWYYAGPQIGLTLSATSVGVLGLGLYGAAYFGEIFRAGFDAIPVGEIEAARTLGMSRGQTFWKIQLPRMAVMIIPPATNESIIMLKESSILSIITVPEISAVASKIAAQTFIGIEPYLMVALFYWLMVEGIAMTARRLETHVSKFITVSGGRI